MDGDHLMLERGGFSVNIILFLREVSEDISRAATPDRGKVEKLERLFLFS